MFTDVTGIILAGGKSSRMGLNKSFLKLGNKTVIEIISDLMKDTFKNTILITNTPGEYRFLSLPVFTDIYKHKGPLAGIHSGLSASKTEQNFVISCDIPLMDKQMIEFIVNFKTDKPVTVCKADGFIQQLAGRYSKSVLPVAENLLKDEIPDVRPVKSAKTKCKVLSLIDETGAEIIDAERLEFYKENIFFNMNRPDDYKKIVNLYKNIGI